MKGNIQEFCEYLNSQVGQPYIWGGQHTKLTPDNYVSVIDRKESDPAYRAAAIEFCKLKFDDGATVLYAYDCSGLGMYWLENLKHIYSHDKSANGMMDKCEIVTERKKGYWVFRVGAEGSATHIGYMVSDDEVIHAKGRAYGVVKERYSSSYWHRIGKPSCMDFDEPKPEPVGKQYVKVVGRSVNVRNGNGADGHKVIGTAHRNDLLPYICTETDYPNWYKVEWNGSVGWISSKKKYTKLVNLFR